MKKGRFSEEQIIGIPDTDCLRSSHRLPCATGRGAALNRGLRAPVCCITGPERSK